ncbi:OsmC family protein [Sulfuricystis multivorans]|uniref:OsmC family protein n=1 Tax=Sulfuricystis multivorans TaxID=2211108 RepID=UPI000F82FEDC|nr:OsmC family protein [Sulfuricystis multivorans]
MSEAQFSFALEQQEDFAFLVRFDADLPALLTDEPPPLGKGAGPNPSRLIAAGVANCLAASLLFALRKFKNEPGKLTATVTTQLGRNEQKRLRIMHMGVELRFAAKAGEMAQLERILQTFEDYCVVTQSVQHGIPVDIAIYDGTGTRLK